MDFYVLWSGVYVFIGLVVVVLLMYWCYYLF